MYKKLLLILLSSIGFGAYALQVNTVVNDTQHPIKVKLEYHACKDDTYELQPGEKVEDRAGICCIKRVRPHTTRGPELEGDHSVDRRQLGKVHKKNTGTDQNNVFHVFESKSRKKLTVVRRGEKSALKQM